MLIRERSCKSKGFAFVCGECSTVGRSRQNIVEKRKRRRYPAPSFVRGISVLNAHGYEKISYCR